MMTWAKYGTEFFDQLAEADLPDDLNDACQLTHVQAIFYVYSIESLDLTFKKRQLRRFATAELADRAGAALTKAGLWADLGDRYQIVHHAEVIRQSLGYQLKERQNSAERKRKQRQRQRSESHGERHAGQDGGSHGGRPATAASQTDIQPANMESNGFGGSESSAQRPMQWGVDPRTKGAQL